MRYRIALLAALVVISGCKEEDDNSGMMAQPSGVAGASAGADANGTGAVGGEAGMATGGAGGNSSGAAGSAAGAGGVSGTVAGAGGDSGAGGTAGTGGMAGSSAAELAMDECNLVTDWVGDEYCINAPPPGEGFQIHIGPSDYENPEPMYVLEPGDEVTESFDATSGNTTDKLYYWRQYRMRPGSHHLIVNAAGVGGRRLGGSQNTAKDNPHAGVIAPENMGVGMAIAASTPLSVQLHYMNYTEGPIIKEAWVNFWYRDPEDVTEPASEVFSMVPMYFPTYQISPGEHAILSGSCSISGTGRFLTLYGHVHANNNSFKAWRVRGAQRDLLYQSFDWVHPLVLEYSSIAVNEAGDEPTKAPGGWTGVLDLMPNDKIYFECDITNATDNVFTGQNEAKDDEMCILVGDTAGTTVPGACDFKKTLR